MPADGEEDGLLSPLSRAFASSSLTLAEAAASTSSSATGVVEGEDDEEGRHTAFYRDGSGRTKLLARLRLALPPRSDDDPSSASGSGEVMTSAVEEELWSVVRSQLRASKDDEPGEEEKKDDDDGSGVGDETGGDEEGDRPSSTEGGDGCIHSIRFECRSTDGMLIVEGVNLVDARRSVVGGSSDGGGGCGGMEFGVEIVARAAAPSSSATTTKSTSTDESSSAPPPPPPPPSGPPPPSSVTDGGGGGGADAFDASLPNVVESALSIRAVLLSRKISDKSRRQEGDGEENGDELEGGEDRYCQDVSLGLLALELGGGLLSPYHHSENVDDPRHLSPPPVIDGENAAEVSAEANDNEIEEHYGTTMTYTPRPVIYRVRLVSPALVTCRSVGGARAAHGGATLVSLTIKHSNVHPHPVVITNVALHPGHSRLYVSRSQRRKERMLAEQRRQSGQEDELTAAASAAERACVGRGGLSMMGGSSSSSSTSPSSAPTVGGDDGRKNGGGAAARDESNSNSGGVIDMSKHVRWGYAAGAHAPELPYVLRPYEALSTVLSVDAGEDLRSRTFVSPVAVTVVVCEEEDGDDEEVIRRLEVDEGAGGGRSCVVATDARWTTERIALVPADAFRVDMSLRDSRYKVGAPLVVGLRVMNLSNEDRNLMLLMAKDEQHAMPAQSSSAPSTPTKPERKGGGGGGAAAAGAGGGNLGSALYGRVGGNRPTTKIASHHHAVNTAVVSEVNGYTFGVWGLSGEDDGTARQNRDHELLAVDAALLLGEVKGQHSVEAELRFVPLREGTLDVPNLKLYDKTHGRWYSCVHCLKIVAAS